MPEPLQEITIVGGGTAGWLTAIMLVTHLNGRRGVPPTTVCLIESPNVPTIGVGEATVPTIRELLKQLRIDEAAFIKRCNVSFKLGVRFIDWDIDAQNEHSCYDHPFEGAGIDLGGINLGYHFHKFGASQGVRNFGDQLSPSTRLIDRLKGPRPLGAGAYDYSLGYAYHLDAGLFARFLEEIAISRGVLHVRDDVDDVELDEHGLISALQLREAGRWPVEFVVDCTGFRGLIIQKALGEPFLSFGQYLLNDRALAVQIPHADPNRIEPCTKSTALEAGWSWRVPLYSRIGTGYVFSSAFKSDAAAMDEFLGHLGPAAAGAEPRVIGMRIGRSRRSWVGNCVAIGLAGGFVEPLESTAIFIVERAVRWLLGDMPDREFSPAVRDRFNRRMELLYAEVRDFIALHYATSRRDDTDYWKAARNDLVLPDGLAEKLARWRTTLPVADDFATTNLFSFWSYLIVLFGKGFYDGALLVEPEGVREQDWIGFCRWYEGEKSKLSAGLPDHRALLQHIRSTVPDGPLAGVPYPAPGEAPGLPGRAMRATITWRNKSESQASLL